MRRSLLAFPLTLFGFSAFLPTAFAQPHGAAPLLHEPIAADARDDIALAVSLDGELSAAIDTPRGLVAAPDPARPVEAAETAYDHAPSDARDASFHPDRDTRRPDVLPYDEPFTPSTAPFKRSSAFDSVDASYTLFVRDARMTPLAVSSSSRLAPGHDGGAEDHFYADLVVDLVAGQKIRIPSVGPGARVLRARAGIGTQDVPFHLWKDGAENWFIEASATARVRLVMELAIARAAFGGDFGNPSWAELLPVTPSLPPSIQRAANQVSAKIGVSRRLSPRDNVTKLVSYFRGFSESEDPPSPSRDIYLDLALSRKGVCRHRAFAFMVTALQLGLPTRMVLNEAHAWVEVHDGRLWRRIDLGGAGRPRRDPLSSNVPYDPPPDPFTWPEGATRGDDLAHRARGAVASEPNAAAPRDAPAPRAPDSPFGAAPGASSSNVTASVGSSQESNGPFGADATFGKSRGSRDENGEETADERPSSTVTLSLVDADAHRGAPLKVRGQVSLDSEPCGHVIVEIVLHGRALGDLVVGRLATDEHGAYDGGLVLPAAIPLGDYDVQARTLGDARCGIGYAK